MSCLPFSVQLTLIAAFACNVVGFIGVAWAYRQALKAVRLAREYVAQHPQLPGPAPTRRVRAGSQPPVFQRHCGT